MFARLVALAALVRVCLAFSDTAPVVAWASKHSSAIDLLPRSFAESGDVTHVLGHLATDKSICEHDAVIIVDQPELHASDLRALSATSTLTKSLEAAVSSLQFPYVRRSASLDVRAFADSLSTRCGSRLAHFSAAATAPSLDAGEKHVISLSMPELSGTAGDRKAAVAEHESLLSAELATLSALFPNHLIMLTSSGPALAARAPPSILDRPTDASPAAAPAVAVPSAPVTLAAPSGNYTVPAGGILARYQLLTPGLITSLLIAFFLLVPAVFAGISALASIQSPLRMDAPKGYSATERKNQ